MLVLSILGLLIMLYLLAALVFRYLDLTKQVSVFKSITFGSLFHFKPQKPVSWFDLFGLINTFTKISNSSRTLAIIDKREVMGSFPKDNFNFFNQQHSDFEAKSITKGEFWFDFMADTGDGYDSATSVFYALTRDKLDFENQSLQRGNLLVIGGDLVYPEGSEEAYNNRFKGPIRTVFPSGSSPQHTYLAATPGNHDWYDGLGAFLRMMCQQKKIGEYKTVQNRSYFAYSIFDHIHMIGLDNQLMGDLDIPQVNFFVNFTKTLNPNLSHRFILFVAEPYWYGYDYNDRHKRRQRMDSMEYIINTLRENAPIADGVAPPECKVIMTGDIHHYARFTNTAGTTLITTGGGGAFKHMTDNLNLTETIPNFNESKNKNSSDLYNLAFKYFDDTKSKKHAAKNLLFPFRNPRLTGLLFTVFLMISLLLGLDFIYQVGCLYDFSLSSIISAIAVPIFLVFILKSVESPESNRKSKLIFSISSLILFAVLSVVNFFIINYSFGDCLANDFSTLEICVPLWLNNMAEVILTCTIVSIYNAWIFGFYLYFQYMIFGKNLTETSSSNVIEGYNHFVRCKITSSEIEFYLIGVKKAYSWTKWVRNTSPGFSGPTSAPVGDFLSASFGKEYEPNDIEVIESFKVIL